MKTILDEIIEYKVYELENKKRKVSFKDIQLKSKDSEVPRDFLTPLKGQGPCIIAEVKKASPSAGIIREDFDAVGIAMIYEENGASNLSVLTDEKYFKGSLKYIEQIKEKVKLPILRKDFTIHEYDLYEARAHGADAILLIVSVLDDYQIKDYVGLSQELGLTTLLEVHTQEELQRLKAIQCTTLVGVNNRDLRKFVTDLQISKDLSSLFPKESVKISESGIKNYDDIQDLEKFGFNGFLVGESLMRQKDIGQALRVLLGRDS